MEKTNLVRMGLTSLIFLLILAPNIFAFGVTTLAGDITMAPGESKELTVFELQNMAGEPKDVTMAAEIITGANIASLPVAQFLVPFGKKDVKVYMLISVPQSAKHGDDHKVGVSFKTIDSNGGSMLELSSGIENVVSIHVREPGKEEITGAVTKESELVSLGNILSGLVILLVLAGLVWMWEKRKTQN